MSKMQQSTFGGRAAPGPARVVNALLDILAAMRERAKEEEGRECRESKRSRKREKREEK